ncbi:Multidrug-efflux transporter 1 regulator [Paenibacillus auburnensis]|uniref:Multidrug-efflux transporter 1 regulator n=1 Tax=Paenibacillus auburnensis TaxID=2905649 RepID=A0ABM9CKS1_9BACL|nr:MerR family transcriptional regulator [Paenibacillus auburnensis]CAH1217215.1 Multidrug-efflux transporter 1 regulator [Paenibacillus auburnensis]
MNNMFSIGEISKLFQIDIRTLRYYDEIKLLIPAFVDEMTGYRYYSIDQFERLNTILYLKALNIPLKEIKEFLDDRDIDHILVLLKEQQRRTEEKIREFKQIQRKINDRIQQIEEAANVEELFQIREQQLPDRMIVMLKQKIHKNDNLEMPIRILENQSKMKSSIFLGQVGLTISVNSLQQSKFDEYNSLFMFIDPNIPLEKDIKPLPQHKYLTIRFVGTHADSSFYYQKLLTYANDKGYALADDALEITYIDYGLTQDASRFVTEIQLSVN